MSEFLSSMAELSRERVDDAASLSELEDRAAHASTPMALHLNEPGFDLVAEAKLASPSEGRLVEGGDDLAEVTSLASALSLSGAAALSILTEPTVFNGTLQHLETVATSVSLPVMRKDFLVDAVQITEARAHGASGVLVIARILSSDQLVEMVDLALSYSMFVLVELFDRDDLDVASAVFDRDVLVGVNARDLQTLAVDHERHATMAGELPDHLPLVAESGVLTPADAAAVARAGYRAALVGTSLVRSGDPLGAGSAMLAAGRDAVSGGSA